MSEPGDTMKQNIIICKNYVKVVLFPLFATTLIFLCTSGSMAQTGADQNNSNGNTTILPAEFYSSLYVVESRDDPKVPKKKWLDKTTTYKTDKVHFTKSITYPQKAIEKGIQGLVKVFFIVEPDGRASHIKIVESLDYECDQAVIKAVHNARFNPGTINGQSVRVHCILPVYFKLDKDHS